MTVLLLAVIYALFVGLGLPDSLFGTAWPAIREDLGAGISAGSLVTLLVSGGTILASLLSGRLIRAFGTGLLAALSTALTALALLGFSLSQNLLWLCLCALPLGLGAGAVDTALNNYVALHYRATQMNFLHCFYGIGVTASPFLMSLALEGGSWRTGYRTAFFIQIALAAVGFAALPLWKKPDRAAPPAKGRSGGPPLHSLLREPAARWTCLFFLLTCGIEVTCGTWASSFLVEARGLPVERAALYTMLYYLGLALGRFVSGLLAARVSSSALIRMGLIALTPALLLLLFPLPAPLSAAALLLAGFGVGPIFPNLLHLTPAHFGAERSAAMTGLEMSSAYVGILALPALFGVLARIDAGLFPWYLLALLALALPALALLTLRLKQKASLPPGNASAPDDREN